MKILSANVLTDKCTLRLRGCTVVALLYCNETLTRHPDEMDSPSVNTSDSVVTVGHVECGLIIKTFVQRNGNRNEARSCWL